MIGVLNSYQFDPDPNGYQSKYGPMIEKFLAQALPGTKSRLYKTGLGEKPKSISECDAWIITGSPKSAYDSDEWITWLKDFTVQAHKKKHKLLGICFGHQLIAHALGGKAEKAQSGWGVGVRDFSVIEHKEWMDPQLKSCSLIFSHQDQVTKLPTGAALLARDEFCPIQMFAIDQHIFCMQGHPEFTPEFAQSRLDSRKELVGADKYAVASKSLSQKTSSLDVGQWIRHFLR